MDAQMQVAGEVNILIVDDEFATSRMYQVILAENGYQKIHLCKDSRNAMSMIAEHNIELVLSDLMMPYLDGATLLEQISLEYPHIPVIMLTAQEKIETAVRCMKMGAFDFMTKPVEAGRLLSSINHALTIRELKQEVSALISPDNLDEGKPPGPFDAIITRDPSMFRIFSYMKAIVKSPKAVLVTGESGTGKELIARALHELSGASGEFVAVNVSGLDDTLFTDTLFGHTRGSYTGADQARKGLVEQARGGTLFLDEIGDLYPQSQMKLLRLLQEGEYYPLGSDRPERLEARIVAATNADLSLRQEEGTFRKDLYYRLIAHHIMLPPLRSRAGDILPLVEHFLHEAANSLGLEHPQAAEKVAAALADFPFPGNIRQLQAMMYDLLSTAGSQGLSEDHLQEYFRSSGITLVGEPGQMEAPKAESNRGLNVLSGYLHGPGGILFPETGLPPLEEIQNFVYRRALDITGGNQSKASRLLDISQSTLSRFLQKFEKT